MDVLCNDQEYVSLDIGKLDSGLLVGIAGNEGTFWIVSWYLLMHLCEILNVKVVIIGKFQRPLAEI